MIDSWGIFCEIALTQVNVTEPDDKATLVQVFS